MCLPDPIECMENVADAWASKNIIGDMFKCGCGRIYHLDDGICISSNPYAIPVCIDCAEEYFGKNFEEKL